MGTHVSRRIFRTPLSEHWNRIRGLFKRFMEGLILNNSVKKIGEGKIFFLSFFRLERYSER